DYYRLKRAPVAVALARWREEGTVREVQVESLGTLYLHHSLFGQLARPQAATHTAILSPFDPLVWDRKRARELFGFDYRLECYTPEAKRQYGYFVLPLLHRGALKGRLDARMLRKEKTLQVNAIWLEANTRVSQQMVGDIKLALTRFARWQGAEMIEVNKLPAAMAACWPARWEI
ncbi:MAG TPA: hypothetical protein DD850_11125, partial [Erwinia persicina]|nr:hypothetical protein [Erwinia persicina]